MTWLAIKGFFGSPLGRWLLIGLAVVGLVLAVRHGGYSAGVKHERAAMKLLLDAKQSDLARCQSNGLALQASIDGQNAAVKVMQDLSDRKLAAAAQALSTASQGRASAEARAARLLSQPPAGVDACARMEAADAAVMGALK